MEIGVGYKVVEEIFHEGEKCGLQEIQYLQVVDPWLAVQKNSSYKEIFKIGYVYQSMYISIMIIKIVCIIHNTYLGLEGFISLVYRTGKIGCFIQLNHVVHHRALISSVSV